REGKITPQDRIPKPLEVRAFGPEGRWYFTSPYLKKILVTNDEGKPRTFAENCDGTALVVRHDGMVYVTPQDYDLREGKGRIWCIGPKGGKKSAEVKEMNPGGVALSPDQTLLYLALYSSRWVYSYQIQSDGSLAHGQRYYHLHVHDTQEIGGAY